MIYNKHQNARSRIAKALRLAALALVGLAAADAAVTVASAEEQNVPGGTAAVDESASIGLQEIIVTARRRTENLQEEPLSVQALTAAEMNQMHITSLTDVANIANVNFTYQPGFSNTLVTYIRGIGEQDPVLTNDSPVAVYVNGVLMARQIGMNFDLVDPQSVEVLRGPQGSLYGRNTTGGAINIILPQPTDEFSAEGRGGFANNTEWMGRTIVNTGLLGDSGLKALAAVEYHNMNGYIRNALTDDEKHWPGADETTSMYFDLHGNFGTVGNFDFRADYMQSLDDLLSGQTTIASPDESNYFGASPKYGGGPYIVSYGRTGSLDIYKTGPLSTGKFGGTSFTAEFPINAMLDIKSISAFRNFTTITNPSTTGTGYLLGPVLDPATFTYAGIQRVSPYLLESGLLGRSDADLSRQRQYSQEFQFSGEAGQHKYVGGLYAFDETVSEQYAAFLVIPLAVPGGLIGLPSYGGINYWGHSESFAVYASDTYTPPILNDKLEFTGGVRYTKDIKTLDFFALPELPTLPTAHHNASFSDPSGDFTAKYQWTPDLMSYVRFANAYKSGGFSGRDAADAPGFKPETANNWEIGGKSDWLDKRVRFNADLFYTIYNNKQVTTFAPGLGGNGINESHVVNAGKAVYPGGEVELTLAPFRGWVTDINYGRVNPKYKEFLYQPTATSPPVNIASTAKFPYFSNTSYSIANTYSFMPMPFGELSARVEFDYKSQVYFHPSDTFNPLNEEIKGHSQNLLSASVDLAHIPVGGKMDLAVSVYGKNLLDKEYVVQAVDYEIIPGADYFATGLYNRPRVIGIQATGKF
jgi:iron complex outermembrane receptor protein